MGPSAKAIGMNVDGSVINPKLAINTKLSTKIRYPTQFIKIFNNSFSILFFIFIGKLHIVVYLYYLGGLFFFRVHGFDIFFDFLLCCCLARSN